MSYGDHKWSLSKKEISFDVYTSSYWGGGFTPVNVFDGDVNSIWYTGKLFRLFE